jgi:CBS domain-containing protein
MFLDGKGDARKSGMRLRVRWHKRIDGPGVASVERSVFCPARVCSTPFEVCERCVHLLRATDSEVECEPPALAKVASELTGDAGLGSEIFVGEAMGRNAISIRADAPLRAAVDALARAPQTFLVGIVVEADGRVVGLIERPEDGPVEEVVRTEELARAAVPIRESATLAAAVARMARERRRALPVVDADGRVVGLITDLDALHWVAQRNSER